MFSIVIPLYNKELSVKNTIQSVLNQTFQDFEVVIVNDGSTDASVEVVEAFNDSRIRLIHQENQGVSAARNRGIKKAKFAWICFLDADDIWKENHLKVLKSLIKGHPEDKVFCTSYIRSYEITIDEPDDSIIIVEDYFKEALKGHFFWTSVTCINQSVFNDVGVFDVKLHRGEDLHLWTRIGRIYRIIKSNLITAIYRVDAENRSNQAFVQSKSRLFNYNFHESTSESERLYYKSQVINMLRGFFLKLEFFNFYKLKRKHAEEISLIDVIKGK